MDRIEKFLRKLGKKELQAFLLLMEQVKKNHKKIPGIRKLVGKKYLYRVRLGRYRIVFKVGNGKSEVVKITKREEKTYKNL